jgi:hypothetical protein
VRRLLFLLALAACAPAAPTTSRPRPQPAPPEPTVADTAPPPLPASELVPEGSYRRLWVHARDGWSTAVAVAPWGDVVALGSDLQLLAREDGRVLETAQPCSGVEAMEFVAHDTLLLVCHREVVEVRFPGAKVIARWEHGGPFIFHAAIAGGVIAFAGDGRVRVLARASHEPIFEVEAPDRAAIALDARGEHLAVTTGEARVALYAIGKAEPLRTVEGNGRSLALSSDGARLVTQIGERLVVVDVATGEWLDDYAVGFAQGDARFVTPGLVAALVSGTIALYPTGANRQEMAAGSGFSAGIGSSADATLLCHGQSSGAITCYGIGPQPPTRYPDLAPGAPAEDARAASICRASGACAAYGACAAAGGGCTATTSSCRRSLACSITGRCTADAGACRASAESCQASLACKGLGLCGAFDGRCALDDAACRKSDDCRKLGACTSNQGVCEPGGEADCWQSLGCRDLGQCSFVDGKCAVATDDDCRQSHTCLTLDSWSGGRCSARNGACVLGDDFGCQHTRRCASWGECSFDGKDDCIVKTDDDCKRSEQCTQSGICSLIDGALIRDGAGPMCVAKTAQDCASAEVCTKKKRCFAAIGECTDNCAKSFLCAVLGQCTLQNGRCVATDASCRRATACRREKRCKASPEGTCVR